MTIMTLLLLVRKVAERQLILDGTIRDLSHHRDSTATSLKTMPISEVLMDSSLSRLIEIPIVSPTLTISTRTSTGSGECELLTTFTKSLLVFTDPMTDGLESC
jgi:hypothetical protein